MERCPIFNTYQARTHPLTMREVHQAITHTNQMRYKDRKEYFAQKGMYYQKVKEYYPIVTKLNKLYLSSSLTFYQQKYDDLFHNYLPEPIIMRPRKYQPHPNRDQYKRSQDKGKPPGEF